MFYVGIDYRASSAGGLLTRITAMAGASSLMGASRGSLVGFVLVAAFVLVGCAGGESSPGDDDNPTGQGSEETMTSDSETADEPESPGEGLVDWDEGLTQQEQLAEIEFVVSVMQEHFGEDIMRADNWTLEGFANLKGYPIPSHRADGHCYYRVDFDFSGVEANQETQEKALAVLEEIGLSPNGEQPTTYDPDRRIPLDVTGGEDDNGRIFRVEQMNPDAGISASFSTRHSDHQSMYEAHEANWEE